MLNYQSIRDFAWRVSSLSSAPKGAIGRSLRRLLLEVSDDLGAGNHHLVLAFAQYNDGYTPEQLRAMHEVAQAVLAESKTAFEGLPLEPGFIVFDEEMSVLAVYFKLTVGLDKSSRLEPGTVSQLREVLTAVRWLLDKAGDHLKPGYQTGLLDCPDYVYRGYPCSVVSDEKLWAVSGLDTRGGSGVLEWCVDEEDAKYIVSLMKRQPNRFVDLSAAPWQTSSSEVVPA